MFYEPGEGTALLCQLSTHLKCFSFASFAEGPNFAAISDPTFRPFAKRSFGAFGRTWKR
jgi:hypothetical protein